MERIIKHRIKSSIVFVLLVSILQYKFLIGTTLSLDILSNFVTFLSILFGFYVTSLAIFVSSHYVSSLSEITDPTQKNKTLLHTLTGNYKFGLVLSLITICYLLIINFYFENTSQADTVAIELSKVISWPIVGVISLNLLVSYLMLNDLIRIIIQEGKSK